MIDRTPSYRQLASRLGAGALIVVSEPAIQHATGLAIYTQRLIPERPVALVIPASGAPAVVCCELEVDQVNSAFPGLAVRPYPEFGADPWKIAAEVASSDGRPVAVERLMPVLWVDSLRSYLGSDRVELVGDEIMRLRSIKDEAERRIFDEASRAADICIAHGAELVTPGVSEVEIAERIVASFREQLPGRTSEVSAMAIAPKNNRSMHHHPGRDPMPESGPVRLGVVGRVDGYWIIITRMLMLGSEPALVSEYARYLEVYEAGLEDLKPGADASTLYADCAARATENGFELTTLKTAHSTGLEFREVPIVREGSDDRLEPGMVLAYDYCLDSRDGDVLHLEDRVEVTEHGPRRMSYGWDLSDLKEGHRRLL